MEPSLNKVADELLLIVTTYTPLLTAIGTEDIATRPHPNKWSRKEILGHLIDSACNNQQKFVRMMQQEHLEFPGYRQDDWVDLQEWAKADWAEMIQLWASYNRHIAFLIANAKEQYLDNTIMIEGTGPFRLAFIMPDYVEHLKHHMKQIFPGADLDHNFVNVYNA